MSNDVFYDGEGNSMSEDKGYTKAITVKLSTDQLKKLQTMARELRIKQSDVIRQLLTDSDAPEKIMRSLELSERRETALSHAAEVLKITQSELVGILIDHIDIRFIIGVKPDVDNSNLELRDLFQKTVR